MSRLSVIASLILAVAAGQLLAADPGRVTQWLVAGPFDCERDKLPAFLAADLPAVSGDLAPSAGQPAGNKKWLEFSTPTGFVNLSDPANPVGSARASGVAAFVYVQSPKVQPARLSLTYADAAVVYLNGQKVWDRPGGLAVDSSRTDVLLGEGWNRLYMKAAWNAGFRATWGFGARLTDVNGAPIEGLKFSVANPFGEKKHEEPKYAPFVQAFTFEHFGIHRIRLLNISPLPLPGVNVAIRSKAGAKLMEKKLGAIKPLDQAEFDIDTDEVSFQQNWAGAVAVITFEGGEISAPLVAQKVEGAARVEYQTPHLQRMKPWVAGRVKTLLLVPGNSRQTIELVQRGEFEWHVIDTSDVENAYKTLEQELTNGSFDCIVVASQDWQKMWGPAKRADGAPTTAPAVASKALDAALAKGTGLVVVAPLGLPEAMEKPLGLAAGAAAASQPAKPGKWEKGEAHWITAGEAVEALPPLGPMPLKAAEGAEVLAKIGDAPVVIASEQAGQRGVLLNFGRNSQFIWPVDTQAFLNPRLPVWERQWSLVLKSVLWAAKKDSGVTVTCSLPATLTRDKPGAVTVELLSAKDALSAAVNLTVRSRGLNGKVISRPQIIANPGQKAVIKIEPLDEGFDAGELEVDVAVHDKGDRVVGWATAVTTIQPGGQISKISLAPDKDFYKPADDLDFTVAGKTDADGLELAGKLLDNHGRCLAVSTKPLKKGDFSEKFSFKPEGLLTTVGRFEAELAYKDAAYVEARSQHIFYVRHDFVWDQYEPVLWLTRGGANWYYDIDYFKLLNDVLWIPNGWGSGFGSEGSNKVQMVNAGLESIGLESLHFFSMNHNWTNATFEMRRKKFAETKDVRWLFRTPIDKQTGLPVEQPDYANLAFGNDPYNTFFPLDDPAYLDFTKKKIAKQVQGVRRFNPITYDLMDEGSYTSYARGFDFDFSPVSIKGFRAWLKQQYGSVEKLNAEWLSEFKDFDEVMPMHIGQVREHVKTRKSYGPWVDHRKYNDIVYNRYIAWCSDAARTEDPDAVVGIGGGQRPNPYGGWDYWLVTNHFTWVENYFQDTTEYIRSFNTKDRRLKACPGDDVWYSVRNLNSGFYRWVDTGHIRDDFSLLPRGEETAKQLEEVRGRGFSKLLYTADAADDPIGIHYSQSTIQVSFAQGGPGAADDFGNGGPLTSKLGFYSLVEGMGYQHKFVSYAQLEDGHLKKAGYKLMILPESLALSDKEAKALKEFVEDGGVLVADRWVGLWTDHGRKRDKSVLEEYFGMDPSQAAQKQLGKGWVYYLNINWGQKYWEARTGGDIKPFWDTMGEALAKAGLAKPRAVVLTQAGENAPRSEVRYYELGKVRYHVIASDVPGTFQFVPAGDGYLYDMRDGRSGKGKIEVQVTPAFPALVAMSPYKIVSVTAKAQEAAVKAGKEVKIAAEVQADAKPDVHAFNFRVYAPDGAERRYYGGTFMGKDGKVTLSIPTVINDELGTWKVKVTDMASGQVAEAKFDLK